MYEVQQYDYNEKEDNFEPVGEKMSFEKLDKAKQWTIKAHKETDEYQLITKSDDETFMLWHDEI